MPIARGAPAATSRSRAPAHFPVPWPGYWPDRPADATGTAGRAPYAGCEERPYTLASAPSRVATLTRAAPLAEGICHVGSCLAPILASDRAAGAGAGKDHLPLRADPAPSRGLRRPTRAGGGAAVVEGGRLSRLQRHPQQQAHEIQA